MRKKLNENVVYGKIETEKKEKKKKKKKMMKEIE